jgi:Zn-dependent protease/CBS domain-containing protein
MFGGLRIARVAGIEIHLDASLIIIFFLITFSLAAGLFPAWHADWSASLRWGVALAAAVLFFTSVLLHELSHALVGRMHGMEVDRITLFVFGGMANLQGEPPSWRSEFLMAGVGPITSLVLGFGFLFLAGLQVSPTEAQAEDPRKLLAALGPTATLLMWLGQINILLALFNLVPGFPLDGGRVLRAILWGATGDRLKATRFASLIGQGFAWFLMGAGVAMMLGIRIPIFGTGLVPGLWLAFIGWFLNNAALVSYRQLLVRENLGGVPVRRLMQTHFERVDPDMSLQTLVDEHVMASEQRNYPVESDGRFVGLVCMQDLRKTPRDQWSDKRVRDIMTPVDELTSASPDTDAAEALELLGKRDVQQLPVLEDHALQGLLRREDLLKWLSLQEGELGEQIRRLGGR